MNVVLQVNLLSRQKQRVPLPAGHESPFQTMLVWLLGQTCIWLTAYTTNSTNLYNWVCVTQTKSGFKYKHPWCIFSSESLTLFSHSHIYFILWSPFRLYASAGFVIGYRLDNVELVVKRTTLNKLSLPSPPPSGQAMDHLEKRLWQLCYPKECYGESFLPQAIRLYNFSPMCQMIHVIPQYIALTQYFWDF